MSYLEELLGTFEEKLIDILCTTLLIWIIFPVIIFGVRGIFVLMGLVNLDIFVKSFSNLIIPWWTSIIMNFWNFLLEYIIFLILTLILVHHEKLEPIKLNDFLRRLKEL